MEPGTTPNQMHAGNGPRSKGNKIKMWIGRIASLFPLSRQTSKNIHVLQCMQNLLADTESEVDLLGILKKNRFADGHSCLC